MNTAAEIGIVVFIGLGAFVMVRISRSRHAAKFGAPPPGTYLGTFSFFVLWSLAYLFLGWLSPLVLTGTLIGAFALSQLIGFQAQPWSRWQQFRDGGIFASLSIAPLVLIAFWGHFDG